MALRSAEADLEIEQLKGIYDSGYRRGYTWGSLLGPNDWTSWF